VTKAPLAGAPSRWHLRLFRWRRLLIVAACLTIVSAGVGIWWYSRPRTVDPFVAARAALDRDDLARARQLWMELKSTPGREQQAAFVRGALLLKKGYYYPALDDLQRVRQDPQFRLPALALIGQAWHRLGRHVEAQAALQEVLKDEPDSVEAHRWLAASYYDLGAIHYAVFHLERTGQLDPTDFRPYRLLGLINKDYERDSVAVQKYEESLRRKSHQPDWADVREELAVCQTRLRRYREALATLAPCPETAAVAVLRAECHHALGELPRAKETLARALALEPDDLGALVLHGTLLLEEGDPVKAAAAFRRAADAHPKDYMAHLKLAQAYSQSGQSELAEAEQKKADDIRELRRVFAELHQAAWDSPEDIQVRLRLAEIAKALGRPDLEEVWLRSAAALRPLAKGTP
jgi:tetratricopeptide (TPR) repeat protein